MNKSRNAFIDIAKAIAMLIIVFGHVLQRTMPHYPDTGLSIYLLLLGVPIFFFLSGMSYSNKKALSPLGFIYDIVKRGLFYMLPFIYFILLRVGIYNQWASFDKAWGELMNYPVSGLWVCWILLWINLVTDIGLLVSYIKPKWTNIITPITLVIGVTTIIILRNCNVIINDHVIGYDYFVVYAPVYIVGYILGNYLYKPNNKLWISVTCLAVGVIGLIPISIFNNNIIRTTFLSSQWMMYLGSLCAVLLYYGLSNLIYKLKASKYISFAGRFSLEMYFLHLMLLKAFSNIATTNTGLCILMSVGLFLLCVVNTVIVVIITYFVPFLHFVMFGRSYSKYEFEANIFAKLKSVFIKNR